MKKTEQLKELLSKSPEGLNDFVKEREQELLNLRFQNAVGQLKRTGQLKILRRSIARARTCLSGSVK